MLYPAVSLQIDFEIDLYGISNQSFITYLILFILKIKVKTH